MEQQKKPVKFRGDRLEEEFKDKDGQWGGIVIFNSNRINKFSYLDLRNSNFGILADSATTLHLDHTIIDNVVLNCLIGNHATIKATNCLFSNSVGYNVVLDLWWQPTILTTAPFRMCPANLLPCP
jgi:hypothetical protein